MRILFLTQVLPFPLDAGPKIRAYYVLRHLVASGHDVCLVSFIRNDDRPEYVAHLRDLCSAVYTVPIHRSRLQDGRMLLYSLLARRPFLIVRDQVPAMNLKIREVLASGPPVDAIHADQLWMAPYALFAREQSAPQVPLMVLDQHNAVFQIPERLADAEGSAWRRKLLRMEAKKLACFEKDVCSQIDRVVWVTAEDPQALYRDERANGNAPAPDTVIPIAMETPTRSGARVASGSGSKRRITFMGGLHWPPNLQGILWFKNEVWPRIKDRLPGAILTVIGRHPAPELAKSDDSIEVTGYLYDPASYLDESLVFIVPLHAGGGMRVKILEAWARGLPVVSTTIGSEGIDTRHLSNIYLADGCEDFAEAVVKVAGNTELADRLVEGGRQTLESTYDWRRAYLAWNDVYPCASSTSSLTLPV
ncbi:MAG: glycosyltransferase family 4 protein [Acidobacteriota bacterium]